MHRLRLTATIAALALVAGCAQVRKIGGGGDEDDAERSEKKRRTTATTSAAPARDEGQPAEHGRPPLPATPSSLVTADAARQLKEELHKRGYLEKPSQGPDVDAATSNAIRKFQQEEGIAATGFPDQETLRRLNIDASSAYRSAPEETNP